MKTTSPHKFKVEPHIFVLTENGTKKLSFTLLPFVSRPGRTGRKTDKFLIQVSKTSLFNYDDSYLCALQGGKIDASTFNHEDPRELMVRTV